MDLSEIIFTQIWLIIITKIKWHTELYVKCWSYFYLIILYSILYNILCLCTTIIFIWVLVVASAGCVMYLFVMIMTMRSQKFVRTVLRFTKVPKFASQKFHYELKHLSLPRPNAKGVYNSIILFYINFYCVISFSFNFSQWLLKKGRVKMYLKQFSFRNE